MKRPLFLVVATIFLLPIASAVVAGEIAGDYLEARTCDVYTGPCFANAEIGMTGRNALMAWSVEDGTWKGVDLTGLKVAAAIQACDTLAMNGHYIVSDIAKLETREVREEDNGHT